jgi:hypothetical protein
MKTTNKAENLAPSAQISLEAKALRSLTRRIGRTRLAIALKIGPERLAAYDNGRTPIPRRLIPFFIEDLRQWSEELQKEILQFEAASCFPSNASPTSTDHSRNLKS